jgi:hypothetical protein
MPESLSLTAGIIMAAAIRLAGAAWEVPPRHHSLFGSYDPRRAEGCAEAEESKSESPRLPKSIDEPDGIKQG